jgi:RNA polymerase sigma-70 factor (ECF subfamily)
MSRDEAYHVVSSDDMADRRRESAERDAAFLVGLRAGDTGAFESLFRTYFDTLYRLAFHDVRSHAVAEEILQDVFCALWDVRTTVEVRDTLEGYLVRAVRNRTLNYLRHARVEDTHAQRVLADTEDLGPRVSGVDTEVELRELDAAIAEAVAQLPPRAREAYTLFHRDGLSYAEIAQRMGISRRAPRVAKTSRAFPPQAGLAAPQKEGYRILPDRGV